MGNREVEFDSKRGPRPAITNFCLLHGGICVEDWLAVYFVHTRIKVAANVRQYRAFQVLILQVDSAPVMFDAAVSQVIAQSIGIIEAVCGQLIKRRIRIGQTFFVSRERQDPQPDLYLGTGPGQGGKEQTSKKWSSGGHQTLIRSN